MIDILAKESPFFIQDICNKYGYKYNTIWGYIKYHSEWFTKELITTNKPGRPRYRITVIKSEV